MGWFPKAGSSVLTKCGTNKVDHLVFRVFNLVSWGTRLISLALLLTLVTAMAVQVGGRYVFLRGIPYTDEIAQVSMTWLVFLSAPWIYRINQHITVQLPLFDPDSRISVFLEVFVHLAIIFLMAMLINVGISMAPMMSKIQTGTLPISRFQMHFLPLIIGAALIIVFAIEGIVKIWIKQGEGN